MAANRLVAKFPDRCKVWRMAGSRTIARPELRASNTPRVLGSPKLNPQRFWSLFSLGAYLVELRNHRTLREQVSFWPAYRTKDTSYEGTSVT